MGRMAKNKGKRIPPASWVAPTYPAQPYVNKYANDEKPTYLVAGKDNEYLPCPHCGCQTIEDWDFSIRCANCGAAVPVGFDETREEGRRRWNRRQKWT